MSPSLSRENFFLTVINEFKHHQVKTGSLEQKLQELILDIAQAVENKLGLNSAIIQRINGVFKEYQAVQLKVGLASERGLSSVDEQQQILLYTEFIDEPDQLRRVYMEALISLLEAMEKNRLDLQRCFQCDHWFIPYQRAQITKFCSSKCRNRYNYLIKKRDMQDSRIMAARG
ncbi:hypothetical protein [Paenibacillus sp. DMB20]|uniref:hypothetical protein n=1 Tax=Paenibacillus sp. DMB20 TaxID=1642570 RepID=UPI0006281EA3|nr:hypothetical protein [Paenibacillus sp. DMB20]KKO55333.1 hypothetical protein XI25_00810 [Paenibacillus sp. DMB20]